MHCSDVSFLSVHQFHRQKSWLVISYPYHSHYPDTHVYPQEMSSQFLWKNASGTRGLYLLSKNNNHQGYFTCHYIDLNQEWYGVLSLCKYEAYYLDQRGSAEFKPNRLHPFITYIHLIFKIIKSTFTIWTSYSCLTAVETAMLSMAYCKTAVTPLLTHWSYCSLALSHGYDGTVYNVAAAPRQIVFWFEGLHRYVWNLHIPTIMLSL